MIDHFVVYTKSGLIKEYGKSKDSRQTYSNLIQNNALFWHLNKVTDRNGNFITYTYQKDADEGELHPIDQFYVDAVRVGIDVRVYPGAVVNKLDVARDFPALDSGSQQAKDIERFRWFSNDYLAPDPGFPNRITDIRYSMIPNEVQGLWSIEIDPRG